MFCVFHKKKIISCLLASLMVVGLFVFSISVVPNQNIEIMKVSSNIVEGKVFNTVENNLVQP